MRLPERQNHRTAESPPAGSEDQAWEIGPRSHRTAIMLIAVGMAGLLILATIVVAFPSVIKDLSGPPPTWHTFSSVVDQNGVVVLEGCSTKNLQPGIIGGGGFGFVTPNSIVVCSFRGADYAGYYGKDCNLSPTGPIPSINGTFIPYDGCVLSTAPLNTILDGIFTLSNAASNKSIAIWSNHKLIANITTTVDWTKYQCVLKPSNSTSSVGPLKCTFMGIPYVTTTFVTDCNLGTPIQVNGVSVPDGSCNLERSEVVSG